MPDTPQHKNASCLSVHPVKQKKSEVHSQTESRGLFRCWLSFTLEAVNMQMSGRATESLKILHFERYQSNPVCFHRSLLKCDVFFLLLLPFFYPVFTSPLCSFVCPPVCQSIHLSDNICHFSCHSNHPSIRPSIFPATCSSVFQCIPVSFICPSRLLCTVTLRWLLL